MKKMRNRWLAGLCALALILPLGPTAAFNDVASSQWYYSFITAMYQEGFVSGTSDSLYSPGNNLTVGAFSTMMANAFYGTTLQEEIAKPYDNWWEPHLNTCYEKGMMAGTSAGSYYSTYGNWSNYGDYPIHRYDMSLMIYQLIHQSGLPSLNGEDIFSICQGINEDIPSQYTQAVATCYYYGFLEGLEDGTFGGYKTLTRAEAAVALYGLVYSPWIPVDQYQKYEDGGSTSPDTSPDISPDTGEDSGDLHPYVVEVVELVNYYRVQAGVSPLTLDSTLCKLAQYKADEMQQLVYLEHTSPTYGAFQNILTMNGINFTMARENIARGQRSPEEVVTDWMNSTDHRANILATDVGKIGVGYTETGYYWSQLFTDSNANTENSQGDVGGGGSTGEGDTGSTNIYRMSIPFFTYDNYLVEGYSGQDYPILFSLANTGNMEIDEIQVSLSDASDAFQLIYAPLSLPAGQSGEICVVPRSGLSEGTYSCTVEVRTKQLETLYQPLNIQVVYLGGTTPEGDWESDQPDQDPELLMGNRYQLSFSGEGSSGLSLSSALNSTWYYHTYGETRVLLTLNQALPEGVELSSVSSPQATIINATLDQDKSQITVTFTGLPFTGQIVDLDFTFRQGYRATLTPSPIGMTVLLNGSALGPQVTSPYALSIGDRIEVIIPTANAVSYQAQVTNSQGKVLSPDETSSYGDRSSGIFIVRDCDFYLGVTGRTGS